MLHVLVVLGRVVVAVGHVARGAPGPGSGSPAPVSMLGTSALVVCSPLSFVSPTMLCNQLVRHGIKGNLALQGGAYQKLVVGAEVGAGQQLFREDQVGKLHVLAAVGEAPVPGAPPQNISGHWLGRLACHDAVGGSARGIELPCLLQPLRPQRLLEDLQERVHAVLLAELGHVHILHHPQGSAGQALHEPELQGPQLVTFIFGHGLLFRGPGSDPEAVLSKAGRLPVESGNAKTSFCTLAHLVIVGEGRPAQQFKQRRHQPAEAAPGAQRGRGLWPKGPGACAPLPVREH